MRVLTQVRWSQKYGNAREEYEDAFCLKQSDQEASVFRLAVADGATEASFSREWAQALVHAYCAGQFTNDTLWQLQQKWQTEVSAKPLPWYAEEKLQMGAYSSLIGLTLHAPLEGKSGQWEALAIGDSCLFQIRNEQLDVKWPLANSAEFNNSPILLSTKPESNAGLSEQTLSGEWGQEDLFYLMTDAMAQYYLQAIEQGGSPSTLIPNFGASQDFLTWVNELRNSGQMRNDDVTLMRISLA